MEWTLAVALFVFGYALIRTAWLADDAYISFRSVNQLLAGNGPVWNTGERVQGFTHPLWFILITILRAVTGEFYFTVLIASIVISMASLILGTFSGSAPWWRRLLVVLLCCSSRAFVDYSTSGLENPLSNLLLALFVMSYLSAGREGDPRSLLLPVFFAGLGVLNRQDSVLIYFPPLLFASYRVLSERAGNPAVPSDTGLRAEAFSSPSPVGSRFMKLVGLFALGLLPLFAWEIFSIVYYGFPFPNTAYAKLNTGIPRAELLSQGAYYLWYSVQHDPVTPPIMFAGIIAGLFERNGRMRTIALGLPLYVAYTVWIGGDFMSGRFLSLPFWAASLILLNASLGEFPAAARWMGGCVLIAVAAASTFLVTPKAPLLSGPTYPDLPMEGRVPYDWRGVSDERGGYYPWTGLLRADREKRSPERQPWAQMGREFNADQVPVAVQPAIGLIGFEAGEGTYIVDLNALTDPLLARLPAMQSPPWRIGHFTRAVPPGYLATLVFGENRIADNSIAAYYDDLRLITRGRLWSMDRLKAIVRLNLKSRPELSDPGYYSAPPGHEAPARRHYPASYFEKGDHPVMLSGTDSFALYWTEAGYQNGIEWTPAPDLDCDIEIARGGVELGRFFAAAGSSGRAIRAASRSGQTIIPLPDEIAREGFDTIRFFPRGSDETQGLESIRRVMR